MIQYHLDHGASKRPINPTLDTDTSVSLIRMKGAQRTGEVTHLLLISKSLMGRVTRVKMMKIY